MKRWLVLTATAGLVACAKPASQPDAAANRPKPVATIHELMEDVVAPTAEIVWNSTAVLSDETGIHDMSPKTDKDWAQLRTQALLLAEVPNLLAMSGRKVVPDGESIGAGGTLDAAAIQKRLDADHDQFAADATALQVSAIKAIKAIDAKDKRALGPIGGEIDEVCESCHVQFWYPPAAKKP